MDVNLVDKFVSTSFFTLRIMEIGRQNMWGQSTWWPMVAFEVEFGQWRQRQFSSIVRYIKLYKKFCLKVILDSVYPFFRSKHHSLKDAGEDLMAWSAIAGTHIALQFRHFQFFNKQVSGG